MLQPINNPDQSFSEMPEATSPQQAALEYARRIRVLFGFWLRDRAIAKLAEIINNEEIGVSKKSFDAVLAGAWQSLEHDEIDAIRQVVTLAIGWR